MNRYLGKPATALLGDAPFSSWSFERSVDEDLPEREIDYSSTKHGLSFTCDNDERIHSIFQEAECFDQALFEIPFSSSRGDVLSLLGTPSKSGNAHTDPVLGEYGAWDRFDGLGASMHIQYDPHTRGIRMVTLMRPDVLPGPTNAESGDDRSAYRQSVYVKELGKPEYHVPDDKKKGVDILAFRRVFHEDTPENECYVLLTNGMSDRRMKSPGRPEEGIRLRAELMWCVRRPTTEIVQELRWPAEYRFVDDTYMSFGHRILMPRPVIERVEFKIYIFLTSIIMQDKRIAETLDIDRDKVEILTVNLISEFEFRFIMTNGLDLFLDLLDERKYPSIFDPARKSYV
jgi:hypothetical protein